jgi:hypothetical protein
VTAAVTADQAAHGRTVITSRAVRRVVSAVTAEALDATVSDVSVELTDRDGGLTLVASAPVRLAPLGLPDRASGSLLDRLTSAQSTIRQRVLQLTGTDVERVDLRITGAELSRRRRVS